MTTHWPRKPFALGAEERADSRLVTRNAGMRPTSGCAAAWLLDLSLSGRRGRWAKDLYALVSAINGSGDMFGRASP